MPETVSRIKRLTRGADVNVNVGNDILDGLDDLLEDYAFREFSLKHLAQSCDYIYYRLLKFAALL